MEIPDLIFRMNRRNAVQLKVLAIVPKLSNTSLQNGSDAKGSW
jgi:hypothetical protein